MAKIEENKGRGHENYGKRIVSVSLDHLYQDFPDQIEIFASCFSLGALGTLILVQSPKLPRDHGKYVRAVI